MVDSLELKSSEVTNSLSKPLLTKKQSPTAKPSTSSLITTVTTQLLTERVRFNTFMPDQIRLVNTEKLTTTTVSTKVIQSLPLTTTAYTTTARVTSTVQIDSICDEHQFISWDGFILTLDECQAVRKILDDDIWVSYRGLKLRLKIFLETYLSACDNLDAKYKRKVYPLDRNTFLFEKR